MEAAASSVLEGAFFRSGRELCAGSRVLVDKALSEELISRLREHALKLKIGPPNSADTQIGCLVSETHCSRVMSFVEEAKQSGVRIAVGGKRASGDGISGRPFIEPTIVVDRQYRAGLFKKKSSGR